jgi:hypothetical protein
MVTGWMASPRGPSECLGNQRVKSPLLHCSARPKSADIIHTLYAGRVGCRRKYLWDRLTTSWDHRGVAVVHVAMFQRSPRRRFEARIELLPAASGFRPVLPLPLTTSYEEFLEFVMDGSKTGVLIQRLSIILPS